MGTITVETLVEDVKCLVMRLQRHDAAADSLIDQAEALKKTTEAQASFPVDADEFDGEEVNEEGVGGDWDKHPARTGSLQDPEPCQPNIGDPSSLYAVQRPENRDITKLQRENQELRLLLEEHQITLDMIMTKYRERMSGLIAGTTTRMLRDDEVIEELQSRTEQLTEMVEVIRSSSRQDEDEDFEEIERVARLEVENLGLRELLGISSSLTEDGALTETDRSKSEGTTTISRRAEENAEAPPQLDVSVMESSWF